MQFRLKTLLIAVALASVVLWFRAWRQAQRAQRVERGLELLVLVESEPPICIVRAVNYLHSVGREEALEILWEFHLKHGEQRSLNLALDYVIPNLFESDQGLKCPGVFQGGTYVFCQGVPLCAHWGGSAKFYGVIDPDRSVLITWAESCRLRDSPIDPVDNPFSAAEILVQRFREEMARRFDERDLKSGIPKEGIVDGFTQMFEDQLHEQVFEMVKHLFPGTKEPDRGWRNSPGELHQWVLICKSKRLYWNASKQAYAFTE